MYWILISYCIIDFILSIQAETTLTFCSCLISTCDNSVSSPPSQSTLLCLVTRGQTDGEVPPTPKKEIRDRQRSTPLVSSLSLSLYLGCTLNVIQIMLMCAVLLTPSHSFRYETEFDHKLVFEKVAGGTAHDPTSI